MPCNSDHMKPNQHERESQKVAQFIWLLNTYENKETEEWVQSAAKSYYGDRTGVHELTAILCEMCKTAQHEKHRGKPFYNEIFDWWELHKAADKLRDNK